MAGLYVYVDGESHFIRSEESWKRAKGNAATLEVLADTCPASPGRHVNRPFPERHSGDHRRFHLKREAGFFWDSFLPGLSGIPNPRVSSAVYFTACSGDEADVHAARVQIRSWGFEPCVIEETSDMRQQRANRREQARMIYKPKGVDIALAVRMLEDAYRGLYDACLFCTSDADYIPLIKALKQVGKVVYVLGYRQGLSERSPFEYVPDRFVDLNEIMGGMKWSGQDREIIDGVADEGDR